MGITTLHRFLSRPSLIGFLPLPKFKTLRVEDCANISKKYWTILRSKCSVGRGNENVFPRITAIVVPRSSRELVYTTCFHVWYHAFYLYTLLKCDWWILFQREFRLRNVWWWYRLIRPQNRSVAGLELVGISVIFIYGIAEPTSFLLFSYANVNSSILNFPRREYEGFFLESFNTRVFLNAFKFQPMWWFSRK